MALSDCRYHVSVTPYQKHLLPEGVYVVDSASFDANTLLRCEWPPEEPCARLPEGGAGGDVVAEQVAVVWRKNQLVYPISYDPKPLAIKRHETQIIYEASFLAQLDGQVAYVPLPPNGERLIDTVGEEASDEVNTTPPQFLILIESPIAEIHAIRFTPMQAVIIDPFVKHSMPLPLHGNFEYAVWRRAVNGVMREDADPAGILPIVVNLNKVDRLRPLSVRRIGAVASLSLVKRGKPKVKPLSASFSRDLRSLEDANAEVLLSYGLFIPDFATHKETVTQCKWPHSENSDGAAGVLEQDFLVTWRPPVSYDDAHTHQTYGENMELEFEGLSGSFTGEKGRPGVEYSSELGVYKADLLMSRPDGSFYIQPSDHESVFAIAVALPNAENGNPVEETLRILVFRNGNTLRLNPKVWHSVPIPLACTNTGILFREIISATNANVVINVKAESGFPIQFVQGV